MARLTRLLITLTLSLSTLPAMAMAAEEATAQVAPALAKLPDPIELKESDVTGILRVLPQLKALGFDAEEAAGGDLTLMAEDMQLNQQALALLKSNGFTAEHFQQSLYTIGLAIAGLQTDTDELAGAAAQSEQALAELAGQMSPEQLAMIRQQLEAAMGTVTQLQTQPKANLALVKKYQPQIEAVFEEAFDTSFDEG